VIRQPDAATLDALVIGTDEPADQRAWEALVRHPGGAEAWAAAVTRRRHLDLLAGATLGRPWLARAVRAMTGAARRMGRAPDIALTIEHPGTSLMAATLGPGAEESVEPVRPAWGQIVSVRLRVGEQIALDAGTAQAPVDVRYLCRGEEGPLPSHAWRLESGEAPVLILAFAGETAGLSIARATEEAVACAGVLLLVAERSSGPAV
jgi:hypothetical protein